MHRRTASALRSAPVPSPRIDFRAVEHPPSRWAVVIPFIPRRKSPPPKPSAEKIGESVPDVVSIEVLTAEERRAEQMAYQRFLNGEGDDPTPAFSTDIAPKRVGIPQKPTSQKAVAQARGRKQAEIDRALKNGRRLAQGLARGTGRPILSSSQRGVRKSRGCAKKSSHQARPAKRAEPLPVLDDALFLAKARHALGRCNPPRMPHHEDVLIAALMIREGQIEKTVSVESYLVECVRLEVAQTQEAGEQVTHGLLRRIVDRSLGLLIKWVWDCVKHAQPYESHSASSRPHRRDGWVRKRSVSVALNRFSIHVCRHSALTGDEEVFFLLERADTGSPIVHMLMGETELGQWLRKLKPCCVPVSPVRLRPMDDDEDDLAS